MKKLLTVLALVSVATFSHAQGLVYMLGGESIATNTAISTYQGGSGTGGVSGLTGTSSSGQTYYYALLYSLNSSAPSTTASSLANTWANSGVTAQNFILAGSLASAGGASGLAASGWTAGTEGYALVVGWSANLGTTWATVQNELLNDSWVANGYFGVSGIGQVLAGGGNSPATAVFGGTGVPAGFDLYSVTSSPVPEPTTVALIGLGGLGLAMIRRRK